VVTNKYSTKALARAETCEFGWVAVASVSKLVFFWGNSINLR
jgi:hypothetical protein